MKKSRPRPLPDPLAPLRTEAEPYLRGEPAFAIDLYAVRMRCGRVTAEDTIRNHLNELGFALPPVHIPRIS